jgi:hypothetical protein
LKRQRRRQYLLKVKEERTMSDIPNDNHDRNGTGGGRPAAGRRRSRRLERIRDLQRQSLAHPDPLQANLGAANGDLMRICYRLTKMLDAALARSAAAPDDLSGLLAGVATFGQLTRQIHRFSDLSHRLSAGQQGGAASVTPAGATPAGEGRAGPPTDESTSGDRTIG